MKEHSETIEIKLSIDFDVLCEEIFPRVNSISPAPLEAIIRDEFLRQLNQSASSQISKLTPKIKVEGWPSWYVYSQKVHSFAEILARDWFVPLDDPYDYYTGILFNAHADKSISNLDVFFDTPLHVHKDTSQLWEYKRVEQKKLTKHTHRMHLNYPSTVFEPFNGAHCDCQTSLFMSNPTWGILDFQCRICGKHYFCSCCEPLYKKHFQPTDMLRMSDTKYSYPGQPSFRKNLCHICRGSSPESWGHAYPSVSFNAKYSPYIQLELLKAGYTMFDPEFKKHRRDAENRLRVKYGYPKIGEGWVSEAYVLNTIKELYPHTKVIHQGSPEWLGLQRFDVWLPEFNIAVEYQGKQHYEPIEYFGGTDGLHRCQERDATKRHLAEKNNVEIIYFTYKESLTTDLIRGKLTKAIEEK